MFERPFRLPRGVAVRPAGRLSRGMVKASRFAGSVGPYPPSLRSDLSVRSCDPDDVQYGRPGL